MLTLLSMMIISLTIKDFWLISFFLSISVILLMLKFPMIINYYSSLALDSASILLVLLSIFIMILMFSVSSSFYFKNFFVAQYKTLLLILTIVLMLCFSSTDFMGLYIWFESSLIPIFLLVYGWGAQPERLEASMYLICYTLFGSFPLLYFIIYMSNNVFLTSIFFSSTILFKSILIKFYLYSVILAFLVKFPMFILHLWLPKVHVEASLSGSMILAAILLKLGAYGMLRLMSVFIIKSSLLMIISLMGGALIAFQCLQQTDLKTLIAYSSVVHMSYIIAAYMLDSAITFLSSLMMMIAHGLSSSCLFFLVNFFYERSGSRNIIINKGMMPMFPTFTLWWLLLSASSISAPFTLNFFSEVMLTLNILTFSWLMFIIMSILSLLTSCYMIFIFSFTQFNKQNINFSLSPDKSIDHLVSLSHFLILGVSLLIVKLF